MRVFLLLDRRAGVVVRIHQFARKPCGHFSLASLSRGDDQPADRERLSSLRSDLDGNLIVRAADAARLDFDHRHDVVDRLIENIDRGLSDFGGHRLERVVYDRLSGSFLAVHHHLIDDLRDNLRMIDGIGQYVPLGNASSSWHR